MGAVMKFLIFPKISGLCQKHALPWNLLEKLGEVFKNNFLTAMKDLKLRIKAGTAKNRCHTISERSLALFRIYPCLFNEQRYACAIGINKSCAGSLSSI